MPGAGGKKVTADEKKKYVLERVNPIMERLVIECLKTMPEDPMPYMLQLLERDDKVRAPDPDAVSQPSSAPAAPQEPEGKGGNAESKGKGKGGKAPPPPSGKAPPPKKAAAPVPAFMKVPAKPMIWDALSILKLQAEDGHFEAEAVAEFLESLRSGPDYKAALNAHGELAATAFVLRLIQKFVMGVATREQEVEVKIQTVGDGRGDSEKVSDLAPQTEEDMQMVRESMMSHAVKSGNPKFGLQWESVAEAWLKERSAPDSLTATVDGFIDDWFETAFKKRSQGKGISEEDRQKKEEAARRKSLLIREEEARRTAHWKSMGPRSVQELPWSDVRTTMWCSGGMGGAVLVQVGESEAIVLKPLGLTGVQECIAAEIAAAIDVKVAQCRVVAMDQAEYGSMVEALERAPSMLEEHKLQILSTVKKHVAVLEFVNGAVLQGLVGQQCLKDGGDAVLAGLGSLVALDCLLNNVDRVPAIWNNDGNLSNVMVTSAHVVIGIDQQINAITEPSARDRYFTTVKDFVATSQHFRVADASCIKIRTAILENTGVELDDSSLQKVLSGAFETFSRVAERRTALIAALPAMDRKMTAIFGASAADVGLGRLELYLDFLRMGIGIVADCLEEW